MKRRRNIGHHAHRLAPAQNNPREVAFADEWERENNTGRGVNYGGGILQDLFRERTGLGGPHFVEHVAITPRERMIAATVVQWLGSNCGMDFLRQALARCGYTITEKKP